MKTVERLYAFQAKKEAKIERQKEEQAQEDLMQGKPQLISSNKAKAYVPIYQRVDKVLLQKERNLQNKKCEIEIAKEQQMKEMGLLTDQEIL